MDVVASMKRFLAVGGDICAEMTLVGRLVGREAGVAVKSVGHILDAEMGYRRIKACDS